MLERKRCSVDGCDRLTQARDLCGMHYKRWRDAQPSALLAERPVECSVEGCDRPIKVVREALCSMHYTRKRRTGDVGSPDPIKPQSCLVFGCDEAGVKNGLCSEHHAERMRGLNEMPLGDGVICRVPDCNRRVRVKQVGLCNMHWIRYHRTGDVGPAEAFGDVIRVCAVEGCERPAASRGWCIPHYGRWYLTGEPKFAEKKPRVEERFWEFVNKNGPVALVDPALGPCWVWTAATAVGGYGVLSVKGRHNIGAHRYSYEQLVGPIPRGLHLDHLCCNPSCVNPAHLEPVTREENSRRANERRRNADPCPHCGRPWPRYVEESNA